MVAAPDIDERVRAVLATHLDVDPSRVVPDARLDEDLCVDSLTAIELVMVLEDEFDIALPEDDIAGVCTIGDVITVVTASVAARA